MSYKDGVQWFITLLLLQGTLIAVAVNAQLNVTAQEVVQNISASICSFRGSCNSKYYYSVFKERDGSPANARVSFRPNVNLNEPYDIKCTTTCPLYANATVSWCIHLLSIEYEVRLCWDESGQYVSPAANLIQIENRRLEDYLAVNNTTFKILQAPVLLKHALVGCFVQSESCNSTLYYSLGIGNSLIGNENIQELTEFPTDSGKLILFFGETVYLNCSGVSTRSITRYFWHYGNGSFVCPAAEDPFCVPSNHTSSSSCRRSQFTGCRVDKTDRGLHCKESRMHAYFYSSVEDCTYGTQRSHAVMKISGVTWSDSGVYVCMATTRGGEVNSMKMNITVEMKPNFINFPENVSQVIDEGTSHVYNCTVATSNTTRIQWVFRGTPIPDCNYIDSFGPSWNSRVTEKPCVTSSVLVTEELFLIHSFILQLRNVTVDVSGQYTCRVQGIDEEIVKRNNLMIQNSIEVSVNVANIEIDANVNDADINDANKIIIPLVGVLASALISIMSIFIIITVVKLFCYVKKPHGSHGIEDINQEIELTSTLPTKKVLEVEEDDWEFPRDKLKLLQKIGVGNFGQVLKARAEGIVPDLPHINIVAVKQSKDAIDSCNDNCSDLWHELEIMKKIDTHPNICNLLACCTTKGGPLCIVLEYAMYGKLKDYLLECKRVATHNGSLPLRIANTVAPDFRGGKKVLQAVQFSSLSSGYGSIIGKCYTDSQESIGTKESDDNLYSSSMDTITTDGVFDIPDSKNTCESSDDLFHTYTTEDTEYCNSPGLIYEEDVINFSLQIASGMEHLERLKIVHRDLAARNILIAEDFCLKICDFGMAKDTQGKGCYEKLHEESIPVKWTAIEALIDKVFTHKSDVWSYGIVIWEICSYGQQPFQDINIESDWTNFICHLKQGNHLDRPVGCRDFLYDKMKKCWDIDPIQRPDFKDIVTSFKSFYITE